jgi:hypothetical protein
MLKSSFISFAVLAVLLFGFDAAHCQQTATALPADDYVRAHYTKYEFRIAMRDGKRLLTEGL